MTKGILCSLFIGLMCSLHSCTKSDIKDGVAQILHQHIFIPYDKLDKRECSLFKDTSSIGKCFTLVTYVDGNQCVPCVLAELSSIEKTHREDSLWRKMYKKYIFDVRPENATMLYRELCNLRIEQEVLFDTCGLFKQCNPKIPDSKLFHTFVLDVDGNVLLVGNPFKNQKLKKVFLSVTQEK